MSDPRKRKRNWEHPTRRNHRRTDLGDDRDYSYRARHHDSEADPVLFIQAHEADLRRGPHAQELAQSLEVADYNSSDHKHGQSPIKVGSALILWHGGGGPIGGNLSDDHEDTISLGVLKSTKAASSAQDTSGIWVDRFDARLLLDALPDFESPPWNTSTQTILGSPSGWSDLPSDTEDTFFFSPEEAEDYRSERRRRLIEQAREERVKARLEEEREDVQEGVAEDIWGGSDEEPDDAQKELMRRTAAHLLSSPNSAQLEMRILANHGADKRFAFLKGRWNRSWRTIKAKLRIEKEEKERRERQEKENGLGVLNGYDSGSESNSVDAGDEDQSQNKQQEEEACDPEIEAKKEIRRQKAKEWAARRRTETDVADTE